MKDGEFTSIRLRKTTRDRLAAYGSKREDYDSLINRILTENVDLKKELAKGYDSSKD